MTLDPFARSLLQAVFAMAALTFAMFFWMSFARLAAMKRAGLGLKDARHTEDLRPKLDAAGRKAGDNYNHLFEAPTAFYAVALALAFSGLADARYGVAAWAFVVFRLGHSLVQATINRVPVRLAFYLGSWAALGYLIVRGALQLLAR